MDGNLAKLVKAQESIWQKNCFSDSEHKIYGYLNNSIKYTNMTITLYINEFEFGMEGFYL